MANTLSDITKVIIAETLDTLREEATGVKIFQNDLKGAAMEQGQIINVPLPVAQTTYSVTPAATPPALVDITKTKAQIALTNWKASRFNLTNKDCAEITNAGDLVKSQIKECARAIVKDVNTSILGKYTGISNYSGTAGTTPFASTVQAAIDARRELNRVFAPDNDRYVLLTTTLKLMLLHCLPSHSGRVQVQAGSFHRLKDSLVRDLESNGFVIHRCQLTQLVLLLVMLLTSVLVTLLVLHSL